VDGRCTGSGPSLWGLPLACARGREGRIKGRVKGRGRPASLLVRLALRPRCGARSKGGALCLGRLGLGVLLPLCDVLDHGVEVSSLLLGRIRALCQELVSHKRQLRVRLVKVRHGLAKLLVVLECRRKREEHLGKEPPVLGVLLTKRKALSCVL
jgi:hypothetical protein